MAAQMRKWMTGWVRRRKSDKIRTTIIANYFLSIHLLLDWVGYNIKSHLITSAVTCLVVVFSLLSVDWTKFDSQWSVIPWKRSHIQKEGPFSGLPLSANNPRNSGNKCICWTVLFSTHKILCCRQYCLFKLSWFTTNRCCIRRDALRDSKSISRL